RVAALCERLGATRYLSPPGARAYLEADGFAEQTRVALEFAEFAPPPYPQPGATGFVSHLSIADVLANLGWTGAVAYLASSAPEPQP
ncbi:MAG: WbqC family protein, partial [Candidatus Competibacter sp.]|nr:WbqC family protein [Candidatus Competibacter sp.]